MVEIKVQNISGDVFKIVYVEKLSHTFLSVKEIFINFEFDSYFKIVNNNEIIYTDLYDLDYDEVILNKNLTIIFLSYDKNIINDIKNNYRNLEFASELKNDIEIIKTACNINGFVLNLNAPFIGKEFKDGSRSSLRSEDNTRTLAKIEGHGLLLFIKQ